MSMIELLPGTDFARFIDSVPDALVIVDGQGTIALANTHTETVFGYTREELRGLPIEVLMPDRFRAGHLHHRNTYIHQPRTRPMGSGLELFGLRKDGSEFPVEISLSPMQAGNGSMVVAAIRDVSERKKAQQQIQELHRKVGAESAYKSLVNNAPYGIYRAGVESDRFLAVNPALVKMLGYDTEEEVLALSISRDVYGDERAAQTQRERLPRHFQALELEWKRKDGSPLYVRLSGRHETDENGQEFFDVVAEDITERRKLEEQFHQSQRLEAVARLAGGVAHDFNNLLGVITGYSWLLLTDLENTDPRREKLEAILQAASSGTTLTRELLAFGRKQVLNPTVLDLNTVVIDLAKMLRRVIGEDIHMKTDLQPGLANVKLDRVQIEQVLLNLVINARDAMPNGGSLYVETQNADFDREYVSGHTGVPPGYYVMLAVKDTGVGMDPGIQSRIFEPFFTTKGPGKGTGLGLASVHGIVKQSGGHVWLYSEKGIGTTFKLYFPRVMEAAQKAKAPAGQQRLRGSETVLLVEDHPLLRKMTAEMLRGMGYKVIETDSGEAAIEAAEAYKDTIHMLVTDVVMPGIDGLQLRDKIADVRPGLKTLLISGYSEEVIGQYGSFTASTGLLQKPFSTELLGTRIRDLLDAS
jgi:two-component system, cell cycle sensor histidine kinase and response regulator CckA